VNQTVKIVSTLSASIATIQYTIFYLRFLAGDYALFYQYKLTLISIQIFLYLFLVLRIISILIETGISLLQVMFIGF